MEAPPQLLRSSSSTDGTSPSSDFGLFFGRGSRSGGKLGQRERKRERSSVFNTRSRRDVRESRRVYGNNGERPDHTYGHCIQLSVGWRVSLFSRTLRGRGFFSVFTFSPVNSLEEEEAAVGGCSFCIRPQSSFRSARRCTRSHAARQGTRSTPLTPTAGR